MVVAVGACRAAQRPTTSWAQYMRHRSLLRRRWGDPKRHPRGRASSCLWSCAREVDQAIAGDAGRLRLTTWPRHNWNVPAVTLASAVFWGNEHCSPEYHLPFCHLPGRHYMPTHVVALGDPEAGHHLVHGHLLHPLRQQVHPLLDGREHVLALFVPSSYPAATATQEEEEPADRRLSKQQGSSASPTMQERPPFPLLTPSLPPLSPMTPPDPDPCLYTTLLWLLPLCPRSRPRSPFPADLASLIDRVT